MSVGRSGCRRDGYDYVRSYYDVPVEVGQRVTINGLDAVILQGENDAYLHFRAAGHRHSIAHPTWHVRYPSRGRSGA